MSFGWRYLLAVLILSEILVCWCVTKISFSPNRITVLEGTSSDFNIIFNEVSLSNVTHDITNISLRLVPDRENLVNLSTTSVKLGQNTTVGVVALKAGHVVVEGNLTVPGDDVKNYILTKAYIKITIKGSSLLEILSEIVGWVYFAAWTVSFYPQIYTNWSRKSVVGLSFDFVALNLVGFGCYSAFNVGLYWSPLIQKQYFEIYPRGVNPVQLNDVFFGLHAMVATLFTILQILCYEKGNQRVSIPAMALLLLYAILLVAGFILTITNNCTQLDYLYFFSYIKLSITLIKYIPQAFYNFRRRSTEGWSIGNIFLDFTGGSLSIMQMFIIAYNYDDWSSIFGSPVKLGLGFFSILFDCLFIVQHYCLYPHRSRASEAQRAQGATIDGNQDQGGVPQENRGEDSRRLLSAENVERVLGGIHTGRSVSGPNMPSNVSGQTVGRNISGQNIPKNISGQNVGNNTSGYNVVRNVSGKNVTGFGNGQNMARSASGQNLLQRSREDLDS